MNWELVALGGEEVAKHVQDEVERMQVVTGALERALELAVRAYRSEVPIEELPGEPPAAEDDTMAWMDYFIGQGMIVYHSALFDTVPA